MEVEQAVAEKSEITSENLKLEPESQEENNLEGNDATNLNNEQNGQASNKNPAHDALAGEADIKMEVVEQEIREDTLEDALAKGRKRKASENKSEGESSLEDHKKFIKEEIKTDDELKNEADSLNAATDLNFLPGQTLGKGKRARIPNKRYSDINLTRRSLSKTENGTESESEAPKEIKEEVLPPVQPEPLYSPSISSNRRGKVIVDMSNPNFLKPFKYGWRRELVYRAQSDECPVKQFGDIYYYTPEGKKLKSLREITENLKDKRLSIDDFTFYKEPIGLKDTSKEVIRDAKFKYVQGRKVYAALPKKSLSPNLKPTMVSKLESTPEVIKSKPSKKFGNIKVKLSMKPKSDRKHSKSVEKPIEEVSRSHKKASNPKYPVAEPPKKMPVKVNSVATKQPVQESRFMENYLQNVSYGYKTLLNVFQYLKVQDLVRAGCVCHMWRDIANHHLLWRTVRMKNSQVHSFEGLTNTLEKHGTVQLDLRKMLLTTVDDIWPEFSQNIGKVSTLRKIELCRCPAAVVESLTDSNSSLEILNALTIRCEKLDLSGFSQLINLRELRLKSTAGLTITSTLESLKNLKHLKHLSLTSVRDLHTLKLDVLAELKNLESLDLGECSDISEQFGTKILSKLTKLERLRLEKGQGTCHTFEILAAVKNMPHLEQLELVNFDIKPGFDKAMGACKNVKKLLIIPTYISQSATTNHMVLGGVLRLHKTLTHFVWGVTLELLRVTELFVDQCEEPDKKEKKEKKAPGSGDSIPVLKPIPLINDSKAEILPALDPPQVEILPLPNLQKLLLQSLPLTRVKILKIPFHATWRQSITDSVN